MSKKTYYAAVEGMINGSHQKVNDELHLTEREAKYLLMSGLVAEKRKTARAGAPVADEPSPATLDMKARKA